MDKYILKDLPEDVLKDLPEDTLKFWPDNWDIYLLPVDPDQFDTLKRYFPHLTENQREILINNLSEV